MIAALRISNFALIDRLEVDWPSGLTVMTGETGAGKSIFLGALQLVLGGRADASVVHDASRKCVVELEVNVEAADRSWFEEHELDFVPVTTIRRELAPGGKSRAFINDTPVTLDLLQSWMGRRIDVHSQRETAFLTDPEYLLELLDALGTPTELLEEVRAAYENTTAAKKAYTRCLESLESGHDLDYWRFQMNELEEAGVHAGAYESLKEEHQSLANASGLKQAWSELWNRIEGEGGAAELILRAQKAVEQSGDPRPETIQWSERLRASVEELRDVVLEAERKWSEVEEDPRRLERLEEQLALWHRLATKHKAAEPNELVAVLDALRDRVAQWEGAQEQLDLLQKAVQESEQRFTAAADRIHEARLQVAQKASEEVQAALTELNLPHARFEMRLSRSKTATQRGTTVVELFFSANPGTPLLEVKKAASGGERSRLMLALKSLFARGKGLHTVFFDEIDTGISGATASQVASIFRRMARSIQVVVITHLPQVAASSDTHWRIEKEVRDGQTRTRLLPLSSEEKIHEVARMMSGATVTPAALENARELIFVSLQP